MVAVPNTKPSTKPAAGVVNPHINAERCGNVGERITVVQNEYTSVSSAPFRLQHPKVEWFIVPRVRGREVDSSRKLIKLSPSLFGYQVVVPAKALPTVELILDLASQTSESKVHLMLEEPVSR
jgi:hypothetical protein